MMWLLIIVLAYVLFGFASFCDKLLLAGRPEPKSYTFYVGIFSLAVLVLLPFTKFVFPAGYGIFWTALVALVHLLGLYSMYSGLEHFEVSKVIATIGATQPIFIFILTWIFFGAQVIPIMYIFAFLVLLAGSVLISAEKSIKLTKSYLKITLFSSLMFSLEYIFAKIVFSAQGFLPGIIWIGIFLFIFSSALLLSRNWRKAIFAKRMVSNKKNQTVFIFAQIFGGTGNLMQSFAISLTPIAYLAIANSLRGVQYALLFILMVLVSVFYPKILKEELSRKIVAQKVVSIALICVGMGILALA